MSWNPNTRSGSAPEGTPEDDRIPDNIRSPRDVPGFDDELYQRALGNIERDVRRSVAAALEDLALAWYHKSLPKGQTPDRDVGFEIGRFCSEFVGGFEYSATVDLAPGNWHKFTRQAPAKV